MRYAILSDVHSNLPALEAVLEDLETQSTDALVYLGDAVGYGPQPAEVIALLRECVSTLPCRIADRAAERPIWLPGNHEWGLLDRADRTAFSDDALVTLDQTRSELPAEQLALLAELPATIDINCSEGYEITLVHAAPSEPVGIRNYITNEIEAESEARLFHSQICLVGHTHYPRIFRETSGRIGQHQIWSKTDAWEGTYSFADERLIMNPGSVGQPRDGDPRAAYAILDMAARTFSVRRVAYNIAETQRQLRAWLGGALANLDAAYGLAGRLDHGI